MDISQALMMKSIDITDNVNVAIRKQQYQVAQLYKECVNDIKNIITLPSRPIIFIANSNGKDSFLVTLATMTAYNECIRDGSIEADRPLVISTVNTLVESIPMIMLNHYVIPRIKSFASQCNINLDYQELQPSLMDEFFIRWGGASKLVTNATRSGDCTVILKTDVNNKYIRKLVAKNPNRTIVTLTGQRIDESARRMANMQQQDVANKTAEDIENELESTDLGILRYAPIRDWSTDQVFMFHQMAGTNPLMKSYLDAACPFPSLLNNHGLLIEIYGNGSNDVCSVVVGEQNSAGCNGRARYGCFCCTIITEDKSTKALTRFPRWNILGAEKGLAVRDYLFRLSASMNARAFHAKAIDPTGFHRICLQPNVLKSTHLESLVWYASQLAIESEQEATRFGNLVAEGRELEHEGYADIYFDETMSEQVRTEMLSMYKEVAQTPLFTCYSQKHALLQSFMWSLHGVAALPYRPLAIWERVVKGERRPYPMANDVYEEKFGKISLSNNLPEARVLRLYKTDFEAQFNPMTSPHYLEYHDRPIDAGDIYDVEYNCSVEKYAKEKSPLKAVVNVDGYNITIVSAKLAGKTIPQSSLALLNQDIIGSAKSKIDVDKSGLQTVDLCIPHLSEKNFQFYIANTPKKENRIACKTERVIKRKSGKITKENTRLRFYNPSLDSKFISQTQSKFFYSLNFETETLKSFWVTNEQDENFEDYGNIHINDDILNDWIKRGGIVNALSLHDDRLKSALQNKAIIRKFHGTQAVHTLLGEAGFSVKPYYRKTFINMLKRTELLGNFGAFDFANKPLSKIDSHPSVISMKQHRADKISCVNMIRKHRNETRRERLSMMHASFDTNALMHRFVKDLDLFALEAEKAVNLLTMGTKVEFTGIQYYYELESKKKAKLAHFWLSFYAEQLTNPHKFVELCLPSSLSKGFISNKLAIRFAKIFEEKMTVVSSKLKMVSHDLTSFQSKARIACRKIKSEMNYGPLSKSMANSVWRSALESHFDADEGWNHELNLHGLQLVVKIEGKLTKTSNYIDTINELAELYKELSNVGQLKSVTKLSFTERLKLMKDCA